MNYINLKKLKWFAKNKNKIKNLVYRFACLLTDDKKQTRQRQKKKSIGS